MDSLNTDFLVVMLLTVFVCPFTYKLLRKIHNGEDDVVPYLVYLTFYSCWLVWSLLTW